jgi:hypothetical protein
MRFMVIVRGNEQIEAGALPDEAILTEMTKFNEELAKAGVLLAAEGLQPTSKAVRINFDGSKRTVVDGPFSESKEVIAGFWLIQTRSREEAIEWMKRTPFQESYIELRQVHESEDFGDAMTPELREKEKMLAEKMAENAKR